MTEHNAPCQAKSQTQETAYIHYPTLDIGSPTHITYTHGGLLMVNWHECTYAEAARRLNQLGSRTVRGRLWTASNLRSFTRRHGITRELHMPPMQKVVDVPGIPKEYAIPALVPVLEVTDGMQSPHVITRIIEKGDEDALARLRDGTPAAHLGWHLCGGWDVRRPYGQDTAHPMMPITTCRTWNTGSTRCWTGWKHCPGGSRHGYAGPI